MRADEEQRFIRQKAIDYLEQRAKRGSREKFDAVLEKIRASDAAPEEMDRLPAGAILRVD